MAYYIKYGQSSIFGGIKISGNECQISRKYSNIKKTEKIVKKMKKKNISLVVLSKEIKENQSLVTALNNNDIIIFDGKWLMQFMIDDIISYLKEKGKISNFDEIAILVNDLTNEVRQNIKRFAEIYKKIRIVTNHVDRFKRLEEELYEEKGIAIITTNNKRKALVKSTLIINFDFVNEIINQYNINENAIIINLSENIKINKKRFCGAIITDYEVELKENNIENELEFLDLKEIAKKQEEFCLKEILEENIFLNLEKAPKYNLFNEVKELIKTYEIKIKELYGNSGIFA